MECGECELLERHVLWLMFRNGTWPMLLVGPFGTCFAGVTRSIALSWLPGHCRTRKVSSDCLATNVDITSISAVQRALHADAAAHLTPTTQQRAKKQEEKTKVITKMLGTRASTAIVLGKWMDSQFTRHSRRLISFWSLLLGEGD
jgi:hypothetical protein